MEAVAWHKTQIAIITRDEPTKQHDVGGSRLWQPGVKSSLVKCQVREQPPPMRNYLEDNTRTDWTRESLLTAGELSDCIQRKIKHFTLDTLWLLTNIFPFSPMNSLYPVRITDNFFPPPQTSIIQTPQANATCQKTRLKDLLLLFVLMDMNTCLFACWAVPLNACHLFQKNGSINVILAVSFPKGRGGSQEVLEALLKRIPPGQAVSPAFTKILTVK